MLGRYRQAVGAFGASLARNPKAPETLSGRAIARAAMGRIEKANADWRRQLALLPESQPAARACVALRLADYQAALPELERAIAKAPDDPYWRLYRQTALRRLGRPAELIAAPADGVWPAPLFALQAGTASPCPPAARTMAWARPRRPASRPPRPAGQGGAMRSGDRAASTDRPAPCRSPARARAARPGSRPAATPRTRARPAGSRAASQAGAASRHWPSRYVPSQHGRWRGRSALPAPWDCAPATLQRLRPPAGSGPAC